MTLPSQIAHYKIVSQVGEGGMGTVYRATDTKLGREVAIKVLPEAFALDAARMARFEREAQVLASLNHPNIAAIYGIEQSAIVMELVEGEELKAPVALDTALDYARQLAAALEAAHEKGVVHRDLKPANIKITPEGVLKVLDFGLAKAADERPPSSAASPTISPTLSLSMTQAGVILGTAAYMSPEQARGKPVDKRADIWAFGVVLYEMLAGKPLFGHGETLTDVIAAVVTREPDWGALPDSTPPHVRGLLERCLRKDPKLRMRDIGEARIALDSPTGPAARTERKPPRRGRPWAWIVACAILAIGSSVGWWRALRPVERPLFNLRVDLGADAVPSLHDGHAISRDGTRIVYLHRESSGRPTLEVRDLSRPAGKVLPGTAGAEAPFFSPDGQWIAFFADAKLKKIAVSGGFPIPLCDAPNGRGGDWGSDGRIVFVPERSSAVFVVNENGGAPQPLTTLEGGESSQRWPQWLPGSDVVLFSANGVPTDWDDASIVAYDLKTHQRKTVATGAYFGRYLPGGYLIYERGGRLFAVRFDSTRLKVSGAPVLLLEDVAGTASSGAGQLDFSRNGTLVYLTGNTRYVAYTFGWMAEHGSVEPLPDVPVGEYWYPRISPDGKQLAVTDPHGNLNVYDFERHVMSLLPTPGGRAMAVTWSPDGRHLIYGDVYESFGIWWRRADGSGEPVRLLGGNQALIPSSITRDGALLAYTTGSPDHSSIWLLPIHADDLEHPKAGQPIEFLRQPATTQHPVISPDDRWLAYDSIETGTFEVYVRSLHGSGKWKVSSGGGSRPKWSRDGRRLFYATEDNRVMVVDCTSSADAFLVGISRPWSDAAIGSGGGAPNFDVAPDGKRIAAFPADAELGQGDLHITFLLNFIDELKRRLP